MTILTVGSGGYSTIQAAVDAAADGDTILVSAGIYVEQVIVTAKNDLTIAAAPGATVTVQAPDDVHPTALSSTGRSINAIVTVIGSARLVLDNIDIDGHGRGNTADLGAGGSGTPSFDGLYLRNSSATLLGVDITGMRDAYRAGLTTAGNPVLDGLQHGLGIRVDNDANLDFTMTGGSITDFQKNATSFNHVNLAMTNVTITGGGAQPVIAQNGIQVSNSTGTISGNTITGIGYSGPADAYSGAILAFGNTGLDIVGNVITGSNGEDALAKVVGIYIFQSGAPNSGGEITGNTLSGVDFGLYADGVIAPDGFDIHDNDVTSIDLTNPDAAGIDFQPTASVVTPFTVEGSALHDDMGGGAGPDVFTGLAGADRLSGNDGNDILDGGAGDDLMIGGAGNDLFYVDSLGDAVSELPSEGTDEIRTGLAVFSMQAFGAVENLTGTAATAQDLRGNAENNIVTSGPGADFIRLQDGGTDAAITGADNDAVYFGAAFDGTDTVDAGAGRDIVALQGNYGGGVTLGAGALVGVETLTLLGHGDARFGGEADSPFAYDLTTVDGNVAAGARLIVNASTLEAGENLAFDGSAETDGTFLVYGGMGTERLAGGDGVDVFFFADGRFNDGDRVDGGGGKDIMVLRGDYSGQNAVTFAADALTSVETVTLMSASDTRFYAGGTRYAYDVTTHDGNVAPGATMTFNAAALTAEESLSFDGAAELDGTFRVFGGAGADLIAGGAGDDLIYGGLGADKLAGGGGGDVFRYQSTAESTSLSPDMILDFAAGDRVDLARIDADTLTAGHQGFAFIGAAGFGMHAGELRAQATDPAHWLVQADTDGDGVADFELLLTVTDVHPVTASDFLL